MWMGLDGQLNEQHANRSPKSCRERWMNHLNPKIKTTDWTTEEEMLVFILRRYRSLSWSKISHTLFSRTDNAIKNFWNSKMKKNVDMQ